MINKSHRHSSRFSVIFPVILIIDRRFPVEFFNKGKVDPMFDTVGLSFLFVPFVCHRLIVCTINEEIKFRLCPFFQTPIPFGPSLHACKEANSRLVHLMSGLDAVFCHGAKKECRSKMQRGPNG